MKLKCYIRKYSMFKNKGEVGEEQKRHEIYEKQKTGNCKPNYQ